MTKSRMSGDVHVRFCEKLGVKSPWLTRLADTVKGADASANIYSIIESAKLAGHIPYFYLRMLMEELPEAQTLTELEALLPYNVKPMDRVLH